MTLENINWLIPIILILLVIIYLFFRQQRKFNNWVESIWQYRESHFSKLSKIFYVFFWIFLLMALVDLRGEPEKIETDVPDQKTLILLDASTSMLAEDVRPNRFEKALTLLRHFVKRSPSQEISVVIFSDTYKQILPFTKDKNLIDSRLGSLNDQDFRGGGSNIERAINGGLVFLKSMDSNVYRGNLLLLTDGESHEKEFDIDIPESIAVSLVLIGSEKGAPIKQRTKSGFETGYLRHNGDRVISKVDLEFAKKIGENINNYKYWQVGSYSLPTEEIIDFFSSLYKEKIQKKLITVRHVKSHWLVIWAVIFLILSYILKLKKTFIIPAFFIFFANMFLTDELYSQVDSSKIQKNNQKLLSELRTGDAKQEDILNLAVDFLKNKKFQQAEILFNENVLSYEQVSDEVLLNYATAAMGMKNFDRAWDIYHYLKNERSVGKEKLQDLRGNFLKLLKEQKQNKQKQKGNKNQNDDQKKKDNQNKKQDQSKDKKKDQKNKQKGADKQESKDKEKQKKKGNQSKEKKDNKSDSRENKKKNSNKY